MALLEQAADLLYDLPKDYALVFDVVHYTVSLQGERADLGSDFDKITKQNPLASWLSSMMICFAGGLLVAPLCGEPVLGALTDDPIRLLIATFLWYIMYYSPKDIVANTCNQKMIKAPLYILKGLYYPKKLLAGLKHAKHVYKHNMMAGVIIAVLKGNGSGMIKPFARAIRGLWTPEVFESMKPSVTTKYCFLCALLYVLLPTDITYIVIVLVLVGMKAGPLFGVPVDPFTKVEEIICPLAFGKKEETKAKTN